MRLIIVICAIVLSFNGFAQTAKADHNPRIFKMPPSVPGTDSFTVKQYYFVMLKKGAGRDKTTDTSIIRKLQDGHMANIKRLSDAGKMILAGPFGDDGDWRGIFIFDCDTQEEVEKLLATDPLIKAGRLAYEIHPWWTGMNSVFK